MISVTVLGRTELRRGDDDVVVALRPRERALLAALALRSPSPVGIEELIWILWGDQVPATVRKSLHNQVQRVRGVAGSEAVITTGARYQLGPGVAVDAATAEHLLRQARAARQAGRWAERLDLLEGCLKLHRGLPYGDLPDSAEVVGERHRLAEMLCQGAEDVTETLLVTDRPLEAISRLERLVAEEPYRDRRWEQLLVARFLIGNRRAALQVFSAASSALDDVGLVPSDRLRNLEKVGLSGDRDALVEALVGLDPRMLERVGRGDADVSDHGPFVGRLAEVHRLGEAFERAATVGVVPILVCGEAGIGKTTLVRHFTDELATRGVRVVWGVGASNPRLPLAAWVDVVERLLRADPDVADRLEPGDRQAIDGLLGRWGPSAASTSSPSPEGGRERLFDALVHLLEDQASAGPMVLVLDDLHLTPPSTRRLANRLLGANLPVLMVATVRTADPAVAARVLDAEAIETVWLGGLAVEEIDGYLCQAAGEDRVATAAAAWVAGQTGGNPLLLRETARVLVNHQALDPDRSFAPPEAMRQTSDDLLLMRLEGLSGQTVAALQAAAVLGPRFLVDDLDRLVTRAAWHLSEASSVGLIIAGSAPATMEFAHQLLHEAIYRMVPEGRRLELHEAAAVALSERLVDLAAGAPGDLGPPTLGIARHHLVAAALDPARAVASLDAAAEVSLASFAYEDAALRLEEAAGVAGRYRLGSLRVCELEIRRGEALRQAGDPSCTEVLFAAADQAERLGAGDLVAAAALALCRLGPTTATGAADDRAAALADRALAVVTDIGLQAELAGEASLLHSMDGDPRRSRLLFDRGESAARQLGDPVVLARVLPHAYLALGVPWELDRRAAIAAEVAALAEEIGDESTAWEAQLLTYSVCLERADPAVYPAAKRARELADVLREPTRQWETLWVEAGVAHLRGELAESERLIGSSLAAVDAVAPSRVIATYGAQILALRLDQGRVGELVDDLRGLIAQQPGLAAWRAALALAAASSDRPELAIEQLATFWPTGPLTLPEDFTWSGMAVVLGRAAALVGTPGMQADLTAALVPYAGRLAWGGSCSYGAIDTVIGLLLRAQGERDAAAAAFVRARVLAERLGAPILAAEAARLLHDDD